MRKQQYDQYREISLQQGPFTLKKMRETILDRYIANTGHMITGNWSWSDLGIGGVGLPFHNTQRTIPIMDLLYAFSRYQELLSKELQEELNAEEKDELELCKGSLFSASMHPFWRSQLTSIPLDERSVNSQNSPVALRGDDCILPQIAFLILAYYADKNSRSTAKSEDFAEAFYPDLSKLYGDAQQVLLSKSHDRDSYAETVLHSSSLRHAFIKSLTALGTIHDNKAEMTITHLQQDPHRCRANSVRSIGSRSSSSQKTAKSSTQTSWIGNLISDIEKYTQPDDSRKTLDLKALQRSFWFDLIGLGVFTLIEKNKELKTAFNKFFSSRLEDGTHDELKELLCSSHPPTWKQYLFFICTPELDCEKFCKNIVMFYKNLSQFSKSKKELEGFDIEKIADKLTWIAERPGLLVKFAKCHAHYFLNHIIKNDHFTQALDILLPTEEEKSEFLESVKKSFIEYLKKNPLQQEVVTPREGACLGTLTEGGSLPASPEKEATELRPKISGRFGLMSALPREDIQEDADQAAGVRLG